jgi:hypothetical protein
MGSASHLFSFVSADPKPPHHSHCGTWAQQSGLLLENMGKEVKLPFCFLTKHHTMKTYLGSGDIASRILNLGTRWSYMVGFTRQQLYLRERTPRCPWDTRLGGPHSRSGLSGKSNVWCHAVKLIAKSNEIAKNTKFHHSLFNLYLVFA